jgi:hypothetical protein
MRPICLACNQRPAAVNYSKNGNTYYRKKCEHCIKRNRKEKPPTARWQSAGYKKKAACDRCGFRARYASQLLVYHVDGHQHNATPTNLRTVCLNCVEEIKRLDVPWGRGDLVPDV